jgi:SAM-dependent methyltransferase
MADKQIKSNLVQAYNQQAEQRSKDSIEGWKALERTHFLSLLQRSRAKTLLEIGAGHGRDSSFFKEQGLAVTAIDLSPAMSRLCHQKGITTFVMDMVKLGFENNSFDGVYALNSFLHIPKNEFTIALKNVRNVLKPEGLFYLGLYGGNDFEGIWENDRYTPKRFFSLYSDENMRENIGAFFEIVSFKHIPLDEDTRPFQSIILRNRPNRKKQ